MSNQPGTGPEPRPSSGAPVAWGVAALVAATVLAGVWLPARGGAGHGPRPGAQDIAADVATDMSCLEWTDGCRVCRRLAEGPACSLPGIACQPAAPRCLARAGG